MRSPFVWSADRNATAINSHQQKYKGRQIGHRNIGQSVQTTLCPMCKSRLSLKPLPPEQIQGWIGMKHMQFWKKFLTKHDDASPTQQTTTNRSDWKNGNQHPTTTASNPSNPFSSFWHWRRFPVSIWASLRSPTCTLLSVQTLPQTASARGSQQALHSTEVY